MLICTTTAGGVRFAKARGTNEDTLDFDHERTGQDQVLDQSHALDELMEF